MATSSYRREKQIEHNAKNNITPRSVTRAVEESLGNRQDATNKATMILREGGGDFDMTEMIRELENEMLEAADNLEFEKAALLRDQVNQLKREIGETMSEPGKKTAERK